MSIRPHDAPGERDDWRAFLTEQGFGQLVAPGVGRDVPVVVPTQFSLDGDEIVLHVARDNPVLAAISESARVVFSVAGDWAHIPGAWKVAPGGDAKTGIPTTYYGAVQVEADARIVEWPDGIAEILRVQTAGQKLVDPLEHPNRLAAIRGIRIPLAAVRAKFKYGGNLAVDRRRDILKKLKKRKGPGDLAAARHADRRLPPRAVHALPSLPDSWSEALGAPSLAGLDWFLAMEQRDYDVFPPIPEVFAALERVPLQSVRVVLLGQDPYHGEAQAHGFSFSVRPPTRPPPSLKNIFKELADDVGVPIPASGDLTAWAERGVLLLNTVLTVRAGKAASHRKRGWESLTDGLIEALSARRDGLVFLLWGGAAHDKAALVDEERHLVIRLPHPSPFSAATGFFGSKPFSKANRWFVERGEAPIDWSL